MKRRSCDICNLKVFLLFCVVLGLFHMPLFTFVSGLGAKSGRTCFKQARQAGKQYLCAQGLALLICLLVWPGGLPLYLTRPYWHLWYLLSLASWQLLAGGAHLVMAHISPRTILRIKRWLMLLAAASRPAGGGRWLFFRDQTANFVSLPGAGVFVFWAGQPVGNRGPQGLLYHGRRLLCVGFAPLPKEKVRLDPVGREHPDAPSVASGFYRLPYVYPLCPPIRRPGLFRAGTDRAFQHSPVFQVERLPFSLY